MSSLLLVVSLLHAARLVAAPPAPTRTADTVATALGARLDSALRNAGQRGFSGVVRVERGGVLLLRRGYGLADRARNIPFTDATVVQIGSNTKDFTLVALLRLQARGRLRLSDSLGAYFPDAPPGKRGITLQQLVDHRGGFPIGLGGDFEPVSRDEFLRRAFATTLRAEPGTREVYSNVGYALLAAVIEQVTGRSYDTHVRDDLLVPLGLESTGYLLPRFDPRRVARGYQRGEDRGNVLTKAHAADGPYWNLRGNGGMLSTVEEMHAFYRALFDGERLLTRATRGQRFDPDEPTALAGSDLVQSFLYERLPRERLEIIVASNTAEFPAPVIRDVIGSLLGGGTRNADRAGDVATEPPPGAKAPAPAIAALVGAVFEAVNRGDSATIAGVVAERFSREGPSAAERVDRFLGMHARLGSLRPGAMWIDGDGAVGVAVGTAKEGPATFLFDLTSDSPPRIRSLRVMVGG